MELGGHKINNWWLIGGAAGVVGLWYWYQKSAASNTAAAASASSSTTSIDPVTGLPYSEDSTVDPITGMTYLTEAQQYGSVQAAEEEITSGSAYYGDTGTGSAIDSGYPTESYYSPGYGDSTPSSQSYSSNAAWAQAATSGLVALGYSSQDVSTALGAFFAQLPLGSGSDGVSYASIIQAAEAEYGPPPQGTYSIIPEPSTSTTGTAAIPSVTGMSTADAEAAITAAGFKYSLSGSGTVFSQTPAAGGVYPKGGTVDIGARTGGTTTAATVTMPNVIGQSVNAGEATLQSAGFVPNVNSGGPRNPAKQYTIISQTPAGGGKYPKGGSVDLAIRQD